MTNHRRTTSVLAITTVAIAGVGLLSACGSNNATELNPNSPSSASHDAGLFTKDINLSVTNETGQQLEIRRTYSGKSSARRGNEHLEREPTESLAHGASMDFTADTPGVEVANKSDRATDWLFAVNLPARTPTITHADKPLVPSSFAGESLSEGQSVTWKSSTTHHTYWIKRDDDTDTKVFKIVVR